MKRVLYHGLFSGGFAGLAGIIFSEVYKQAMWVDFSVVITPLKIFSTCVFVCLLISLAYYFFQKIKKGWIDTVFNILLILGSFFSIILPLSYTLPLDLEFPELFIGLTIPMHFFPALFWLGTKDLFKYS